MLYYKNLNKFLYLRFTKIKKMQKITFITLLLIFQQINAQNKLYINLATHNEMLDEYYDTDETEYNSAKTVCNQILTEVTNLDARWNFQTCSKFVLAALNWESAYSNTNDLLERMYLSGKVQIDPRNKTQAPIYNYNISDVYHLLDSCGVTSTHTVGGFLHYPYTSEDWTQFRNPKIGAVYGLPWQAEIIWGGGSPGHINDANDYGVWKPKDGDSEANFYTHEPSENLWLVGNGCAPVIYDTTTNVQWIVNLVRSNIEKIQSGVWPTDKFYSLSVMTNVKHFDSPGYFQKVKTVLDSLDVFVGNGGAQWATITDKLNLFQQWINGSGITFSQWSCETAIATTGIPEAEDIDFVLYPNPVTNTLFIRSLAQTSTYQIMNAQGKIITFGNLISSAVTTISMEDYPAGIYFVKLGTSMHKIMKE